MSAHPRNPNKKATFKVALGRISLVAGVGFEPTTFGL